MWSEERGPKERGQREPRATWRDAAARGRERDDDWRRRQSGKPGPEGRPRERIARRSGGKGKPSSASVRARSVSERPGRIGTPEEQRWARRDSARGVRGRRPLRVGVGAGAVAARVERRRSPAAWEGVRVLMRRSTSTI